MPDTPFADFFFGPGFWVAVGADFLLVVSLYFTAFYAAALLLSSFLPARSKLAPNGLAIPCLLTLALLFTLSPAGEYLTAEARAALNLAEIRLLEPDLSDPALSSSIKPWLLLLWLAGATITLLLLAARHLQLYRTVARLRRLGPDPALASAAIAAGCNRRVSLLEAGAAGPVASWGLFRPIIMVPSGFAQTHSERERHCVYLHELVHIRGRDSWKNLLAGLARAFFWFNPAVRHAMNRYGNHLEIACDRKVIRLGQVSPDEYAAFIARSLRTRHGLLTEFSADCRDVVRRLGYIFEDRALLSPLRERLWTAACAAGLALCFSFSLGSDAEVQALFPEPDEEIMALMRREAEEAGGFRWGGLLGVYSATVWNGPDEAKRP